MKRTELLLGIVTTLLTACTGNIVETLDAPSADGIGEQPGGSAAAGGNGAVGGSTGATGGMGAIDNGSGGETPASAGGSAGTGANAGSGSSRGGTTSKGGSGGGGSGASAGSGGTTGGTGGTTGGTGASGGSGGSGGSGNAGSGGSGGGPDRVDTPACTNNCECNNGIDDDGDGLVDWQQDLGCTSRDDGTEGGLASGTIENGWTVVEPSADSRIVYVSSSVGSDTADGLAPDPNGGHGPKKTIAEAVKLLRDGYPDWLLLRRGDSWKETSVNLKASGRSATERVVLASYGESLDMPIVYGWVNAHRNNLLVAHLDLEPDTSVSNPTVDVQGSNVTVEGNHMIGGPGAVNAVVDASTPMSNVQVRRNSSDRARGNAFFLSNVHNLLVEENVIFEPGMTDSTHAMYITRVGNENVVTRGNLVYMGKATGNGIMQRAGGLSEGNVLVACGWTCIAMGSCNDEGGPSYGACEPSVNAEYRDNLLMDGFASGSTGLGGDFDYVAPGTIMAGNIAIRIALQTGAADATFDSNIVQDAPLSIQGRPNITWSNNQVFGTLDQFLVLGDELPNASGFSAQDNHFYSLGRAAGSWFKIPQSVGFDGWQKATGETGNDDPFSVVDATRTLAGYAQSIGGDADAISFFQGALQQAKFRYLPEYTAPVVIQYFKDGLTIKK